MSRPPNRAGGTPANANGSARNGSASASSTRRTTSTGNAIPISYAYGAPALGNQDLLGHRRSRSRSRPIGGQSANLAHRGEAPEETDGSGDDLAELRGVGNGSARAAPTTLNEPRPQQPTAGSSSFTFTAPGAAPVFGAATGARSNGSTSAVRGGSNNTSVNIASAFAQAIKPDGERPRLLQGARRSVGVPETVADDEGEESESGKETQRTGNEGASRKRKKATPRETAAKNRMEDSGDESDEVLIEGAARGTPRKTSTVVHTSPKQQTEQENGAYQPDDVQDNASSSESSDDAAVKRRRSHGKGRASSKSREPGAILLGQVAGDVWSRKKRRKSTRGKGRTSGTPDLVEEGEEEEGPVEDPGGEDERLFDDAPPQDDSFVEVKDEEADENTSPSVEALPPATRFLPAKSPAAQDTPHAPGHLALDSIPTAPRLTSLSFRDVLQSAPRDSTQDARFFRVDASTSRAEESRGYDRSLSIDESGVAPSGYSYSEESMLVVEEYERRDMEKRAAEAASHSIRRRLAAGPTRRDATPLEELEESEGPEQGIGATLGRGLRPLWRAAMRLHRIGLASIAKWLAVALLASYLLYLLMPTSRVAPPSTTFTAPILPPESLEQLIQRLTHLEQSMGQLSTLAGSDRQSELDQVVQNVKADLISLDSRVQDLDSNRQTDYTSLVSLSATLHGVEKDLGKLESKVEQVVKDVKEGSEARRLQQVALRAIEEKLPARMAVRMDARGRVELDPMFWKYLKDAFVETKDLAGLSKVVPGAGSSAAPTWDGFIAANEAALKAWVTSEVDSRLSSSAVVSRTTVLDIVNKKLKTLMVTFDQKANENKQEFGEELLRKAAQHQKLLQSAVPVPSPPATSPAPSQVVTHQSADGQSINELIELAILRYSKDVLARPDYALFSSGARVIPSLTSPTYSVAPEGLVPKVVGFLSRAPAVGGRPPVTALSPSNALGACWPLAGTSGTLGILLSRTIVPTDVTIEHASIDVALDGDLASAPREFELWGLVEEPEELQRVQTYREERIRIRREAFEASGGETTGELDEEQAASIPPTPTLVLLAVGVYDTTARSHVQTFPVTATAREMAVPVSAVILKVLSNYGAENYTCLYRVRVSGQAVRA